MAYYVRAFCTSGEVPPVIKLLQWLKLRNVHLRVENLNDPFRIQSREWQRVALAYKEGKLPIIADCGRNDLPGDCPGRKQIERFVEALGSAGGSREKQRIQDHLRKTRFVICLELPVWDMDEDGYDANGQILAYFAENCGALIQADGEGFYERGNLILPAQ